MVAETIRYWKKWDKVEGKDVRGLNLNLGYILPYSCIVFVPVDVVKERLQIQVDSSVGYRCRRSIEMRWEVVIMYVVGNRWRGRSVPFLPTPPPPMPLGLYWGRKGWGGYIGYLWHIILLLVYMVGVWGYSSFLWPLLSTILPILWGGMIHNHTLDIIY